jgi:hypothetical protein
MTKQQAYRRQVVLGGIMIIVLATEPKVHGFKSRQECWIFKRDKIHRISFGGEVKLLAPCQRYYGKLKIP